MWQKSQPDFGNLLHAALFQTLLAMYVACCPAECNVSGTIHAGHVKTFLNRYLEGHLTAANAARWLELTSKSGLDEEVTVCVKKIAEGRYPLPLGLSSNIKAKHTDQLLQERQVQLSLCAALTFGGCGGCDSDFTYTSPGSSERVCHHCRWSSVHGRR